MFPSLSDADNLEKADHLLTIPGDYQITVINNSNDESADYAMAFERAEPIPADFNADSIVDCNDLSILAGSWLGDPCSEAGPACGRIDLLPDGIINQGDFDQFTRFWLLLDERYYPYP